MSSLASMMSNVKTVEKKSKAKVISKTTGKARTTKKAESKVGGKKISNKNKSKGATKKNTPKRVQAKTSSSKSKRNTKENDLTRIEGIGPAIQKILKAKGIKTFRKLSNTKIAILREILEKAGPRFTMHVPDTWARQAGMAASGKWEKLKAWQDKLHGGK